MTKKQINWVGFLCGILLFSVSLFRELLFINSFFGVYVLMFLKTASILVLGYFFAKIISVNPLKFLIIGVAFEAFVRLSMPLISPLQKRVSKIYKYPKLKSIILPIVENALTIARGIGSDMGAVQYYETGSRYDKELFYTFEPSTFTFQHIDFDNQYSINSMGVRDDEQSLKNPEIVFVGDSFTTGIGVDQDETFSDRVQKNVKKNTLNIGIPSYGTAREYLFLKRFNLDSCKYIVLQYCDNDDTENRAFVSNGFGLHEREEKDYKSAQIYNQLVLHYYPFRYTYSLFAKRILFAMASLGSKKTSHNAQPSAIVQTEPTEDFFKILQRIQNDYPDKKIIIFELGLFSTGETFFVKMKKLIEQHNIKNVELINTSKFINCDDCYYNLDFHITPKGSAILADSLISRLKK